MRETLISAATNELDDTRDVLTKRTESVEDFVFVLAAVEEAPPAVVAVFGRQRFPPREVPIKSRCRGR